MARACICCQHAQRNEIDRQLAAGQSLRDLSALFRVSEDSLARHRDRHLPQAVQKAQEQEDVRHALDVVAQLKAINGVTMQILSEARQQRNPDVALKAIDRIERQITLQARLLGDLDDRPVINLLISPEWARVRAVVVDALGSYPEAKRAVVLALSANGGSESGANR